jgi:hypothetical protein
MRTWAEWNDAVPGFVEIDLVGHEGGNSRGEFCFTLDITDIASQPASHPAQNGTQEARPSGGCRRRTSGRRNRRRHDKP